jgi:hypothetical protein
MINFITKCAGIFFCLAGYICVFVVLAQCAIIVPSWGATLMMIASIISITGQFFDLLIEELEKL